MTTKILLTLVGAAILVVVGAYFLLSPYAQKVEHQQMMERQKHNEQLLESIKKIPQVIVSSTTSQQASSTHVDAKNIEPNPVVKPIISTPKTASPYTVSEVAKHNGVKSCWTIINGGVYDITPFVPQHPGGEPNILQVCGIDGTVAFEAQHEGQRRPQSTLAKYYLGDLTQ